MNVLILHPKVDREIVHLHRYFNEVMKMNYFLPKEIMVYIKPFRQIFSKPTWPYFKGFLLTLLVLPGRKTVTQITRACFFIHRDQSSFNRFLSQYIWDIREVKAKLLKLLIQVLKGRLLVHGALLVALDTTLIAKASQKMIGVQRWKDTSGNSDRGSFIRGHQWGILALLSFHKSLFRYLCWPILARIIPGNRASDHFIAGPDEIRLMKIWDVALALVIEFKLLLEKAGVSLPLRVVADAFFSKAPFFNPLIREGIHVISKLRHDAVGRGDPPPYSGQGRPPTRGKKLKIAALWEKRERTLVKAILYGKVCSVEVVTVDLLLRNLDQKVRVVITESRDGGEHILLVSTDRSLSAKQILEIYAARFSLEIAIRDLKEEFGLGHYQFQKPLAIHRFIHLVLFARSFWQLVLLKVKPEWIIRGCCGSIPIEEAPLSWRMAKRKLRAHLLIKYIYQKSAWDADLDKVEEEYEPISRILV